jgi:hypothetical protein
VRTRLPVAVAVIGQLFAAEGSGQTAVPAAAAPTLWAQFDLQATTRRLWHGLTRVSGLGVTSQAQIGTRVPLGSLAAGAMQTWDLCQCLGNVRLLGGRRRGLGELDLWGEYRIGTGDFGLSAGVVRYIFEGSRARGGIGSESNSTELYVTAEAQQIYLSPRLSAWIDLGPVGGTYLELGETIPLLGWPYPPFLEVYLDGELGFSISQGPNPNDPAQLARFRSNSFTHARLKVGADVLRRAYTTIPISLEFQANFDGAAKRPRSGVSRDFAFGLSAGLLWYLPLAGRRR